MNRTIEQWQDINPEDVAYNATTGAVQHLVQSAISDLQELARQRDALLAMLDNVGDEKLLALLGCEDFNLYIDISKGSMK